MESKDRRVAGGFLPGLVRVGWLQIMADSSGNWRQDKGETSGSRPTEPGRDEEDVRKYRGSASRKKKEPSETPTLTNSCLTGPGPFGIRY